MDEIILDIGIYLTIILPVIVFGIYIWLAVKQSILALILFWPLGILFFIFAGIDSLPEFSVVVLIACGIIMILAGPLFVCLFGPRRERWMGVRAWAFIIWLGQIGFILFLLSFSLLSNENITAGLMLLPIAFTPILIMFFFVGLFSLQKTQSRRKIGFWAMLVFAFIFMLLFLPLLPTTVFSSLVFYIGLLAVIFGTMLLFHRASYVYTLSTLSAAVRQNLPLAVSARMACNGQPVWKTSPLRNISEWLCQGYSLSESITRGYCKCPASALGLIRIGEKAGKLKSALKQLEDEVAYSSRLRSEIELPVPWFYLIFIIVLLNTVFMASSLVILPKYYELIREVMYEINPELESMLPWTTKFLLNYNQLFSLNSYAGGIAFIVPAGLFIVLMHLRVKMFPPDPARPYFTSVLLDRIKWYLPVVRWFEVNSSVRQTIGALRLGLSANLDMKAIVGNMEQLHVNHCFKRKLRRFGELTSSGISAQEAAVKARLGRNLVWVFSNIQDNPCSDGFLGSMEEYYSQLGRLRRVWVKAIVIPACVVLLGCIVAIGAHGFFSAMIAIWEGYIATSVW